MSAAPGRGLASGFHHPQTQGFLGHCHPRLHPLPCGHLPGPEVGCLCTAAGRHCPSTQRPHSPPESSSRHPSPGRHPGSPFGPSLLPTWAHSSHPAVTEASGTVGEAHPPGLPRNAGHPSDRSDPRGRTGTYAEEVWESWGAPGVLEGTLLPAHRPALTVTLTALPPVSPGVTSVRSGEAQSETSGGGTGWASAISSHSRTSSRLRLLGTLQLQATALGQGPQWIWVGGAERVCPPPSTLCRRGKEASQAVKIHDSYSHVGES